MTIIKPGAGTNVTSCVEVSSDCWHEPGCAHCVLCSPVLPSCFCIFPWV